MYFVPSCVLRTLHAITHLIFIKEEGTIPWRKEIKLFILTSESKNIGVQGNLQFTEFTFLSIDKDNGTQRHDVASPHHGELANW